MRVALVANVSPQANPYITLFQQAVQPYCAEPVPLVARLTPGWALRQARPGGIVHVHWVESQIRPQPWFGASAAGYRRRIYKRGHNRLVHPARMAGELGRLALALALARRAGARLVYTLHNLEPNFGAGYSAGLAEAAHRLILAGADAIHVHSQAAARAVAARYGRRRAVFVVPHGHYIGQYPNRLSPAEARARLGLAPADFVALALGQIAPYKGLESLLAAQAELGPAALKLVIAGKVAHAEYGAQIAALAQGPGVLYRPGFVPDDELQVYLNAADVVALPYARSTTSGSALLALSFGRPVVAPALDFLAEVVPPLAGVLYPPAAAGGLTTALRQARAADGSAAAILAHARQYDWRAIGAQMAEIYRAALGAAGTPLVSEGRSA